MPVVNGKPGSRRIRGVVRAQLQRAALVVQSVLNYDDKCRARTPPTVFLTDAQRNQLVPIPNLCATIWTDLNV